MTRTNDEGNQNNKSFGFGRDGFVAGTQCGAFSVEGVEFAKDGFEGALAGGFLATEHAAAFVLFAEIGLNGFVVTIGDADELRREAEAQDGEFVQLGFQCLCLARTVPFANDGLEGDIGSKWKIVRAGAELDGGAEGIVEFLPTLVGGPVLCDGALREVDEVNGPPFFDFERALKSESVQESELPIIVLREFFEHGTHGTLAILKFQKFSDEELRAAAIDVIGFSPEQIVSRPAQIVERKPGVTAQNVAGRLQGILHRAIRAREREHEAVDVFARGWQDNFHFARGKKLFGETFDEPGRRLCRASAGIAIGEFEQESVGDRTNIFAASHDVGQLDEIFPAVAEAFAVDGDRGIRPGRETEREMDSAAPWSGIGEFAVEELFDAFGGNGEHGGFEDNQGRVCAEVGGGFGRTGTARVMHEELAAEAASQSVDVLGE
jgi:hypothetical protein